MLTPNPPIDYKLAERQHVGAELSEARLLIRWAASRVLTMKEQQAIVLVMYSGEWRWDDDVYRTASSQKRAFAKMRRVFKLCGLTSVNQFFSTPRQSISEAA